jgi:hypothetical protein
MLTRDYFMRIISQLAAVLASVLRLMKLNRHEEALEEIQTSSKQLLGMDLRLLSTLSDAEFIRLLSLGERFDVEKCVAIAELLRIVGDVRADQGKEEEGSRARLTALSLFLELSQQETGSLPQEYHETVENIIRMLTPAGMPARINKKLFSYYESLGKFAKAEDALFRVVEEDPTFVEAGIKFYERLRLKSDKELELGGLPRNEIDSSVQDLSRRRRPS